MAWALFDVTPARGIPWSRQEDARSHGLFGHMARLVQDVPLTRADREVILLQDDQQLDTAAVAEALDIKPDAVRQRYGRAVNRLGEAFRHHVDQDGAGA